tara:strand:- start:1758 stop:2444 length:687 start_codon:yes stop_codon:yes gene_type:complete
MNNIKKYIIEKHKGSRKTYHYFYGDIPVYIKDTPPAPVNIERVLNKVEATVPRDLIRHVELDMLIIGHIPEFEERQINALYKDGAIYVTDAQSSNDDMVDDIVHEIAHCFEEAYMQELFGDMALENEFVEKRKKVYNILLSLGHDVPPQYFLDVDYDEDFDMFLYTGVGYPTLVTRTYQLFTSPYAITSLREYFAKGFEEYYLGDKKRLKEISPVLYNKIVHMVENGN